MAAFFGVFLAAGLGFLTPIFILPVARMAGAIDWQPATCEIIEARLYTSSDSDGSTYRVDVNYRYEFGGRSYAGDRYRFMRMTTSGRDSKASAVARLNRERRVPCWVNPENPAESVIERGPSNEMWFALIPLVFVLVGGGGIYGSFVAGRAGGSGALSLRRPSRVAVQMASSGPGTLKPRWSRGGALVAFLFFALFWNGIVSVFLYQLAREWIRGSGFQWFLALFLIPFVIVGLILIVATVHRALAIFNPHFTLAVTSSRVALGEELAIEWGSTGRIDKLTRFTIELEGREEARYRRGTDTATDTRVFATHVLVQQLPPEIIGSGRARVALPADTMHSFEAANNKIVWLLRVKGEVPNWPDTDDEFPITVGPRR